MDLKAVSWWEALSLCPKATVFRGNDEKIANRDLYISDWNSLPPRPLVARDLMKHDSSLADLDEYSISKSTGPDDSFFHLSGCSHKYSNLKGGSSSTVGGAGGRSGEEGMAEVDLRRAAAKESHPQQEPTIWSLFHLFPE